VVGRRVPRLHFLLVDRRRRRRRRGCDGVMISPMMLANHRVIGTPICNASQR